MQLKKDVYHQNNKDGTHRKKKKKKERKENKIKQL